MATTFLFFALGSPATARAAFIGTTDWIVSAPILAYKSATRRETRLPAGEAWTKAVPARFESAGFPRG